MKIFEFIESCDLINSVKFPTVETPIPVIPSEIMSTFEVNRISIIGSYFDDIQLKLSSGRFSELFDNNIIFLFPSKTSDLPKFIELVSKINQLIKIQPTKVNLLLDFQWWILDYMYHDNSLFNGKKEFLNELTILKEIILELNNFESEVALLLQKIDHWE